MFSQVVQQDIQEIHSAFLHSKKVRLLVQRENLNDPYCMGNKWWKLRYNLIEAIREKHNKVLTFGGAFSNHIVATASACNRMGLKSIGIIRGDSTDKLNPSLIRAQNDGMELFFVDRQIYRNKSNIDWKSIYGDHYLIPEGGTNELAVSSCEEMISFKEFDMVCVPVGTGGTLSGIIRSLKPSQHAIGFSSLKGGGFLNDEVKKYVDHSNWSIQFDYHFGGYAKINLELLSFMNEFKRDFSIQLDPVYTAKMFYGIFDMIKNEQIRSNSTILAVHTGGTQGIEGMNQRIQSKEWKID
ncbi:MAG: 1-aminocyclopropane-1-carboxylate deaminase [Flavobacteriales bacterium]|nr:1-aminocyclopropane-1-carboxylate deaminase [Flavobacteriales bacterium]